MSPYKLVYSLFPDEAEKAPMARQQYINGHFCYSYKAGIVTNGLGIVRHIAFFDDSFRKEHPEIVTPKTDDPEKDKEIADSVSLKPVLTDFFKKHNLFQDLRLLPKVYKFPNLYLPTHSSAIRKAPLPY